MSLLDIAQSIKKEGFDPRKDSANGPAPIPAGEYQAILKSVQFNVAESGWEAKVKHTATMILMKLKAYQIQAP